MEENIGGDVNSDLSNLSDVESSSSDSGMSMFSSSSSENRMSDESDEDEDDILFSIFQILLHGRPRVRVVNFVETALAKSSQEFREDFRVSRAAFDELSRRLEESGYIPNHRRGRPKKSAQLALLMTLWFVANHSAHRSLSHLFHVSFSSVHRILRRVVDWLVSMMHEYIVWPQGADVQRISKGFHQKAGISKCIGAIDGSHIAIQRPEHHGRDYFNRKHGYSILLQGVVDCDFKFTNVYCGDPGSFHDVRLLRRSELYHEAERNVAAVFPDGTFLLGDKGYVGVGHQWIVTPFRDSDDLLPQQHDFNRRVCSTRVVVEQAFGILKARFRRLFKMELRDMAFMVRVVIACCVLQNVCITFGDDGHDLQIDEENDDDNLSSNDNDVRSSSSGESNNEHGEFVDELEEQDRDVVEARQAVLFQMWLKHGKQCYFRRCTQMLVSHKGDNVSGRGVDLMEEL